MLALDEIFEVHELVRRATTGDDDSIKVLLWLAPPA